MLTFGYSTLVICVVGVEYKVHVYTTGINLDKVLTGTAGIDRYFCPTSEQEIVPLLSAVTFLILEAI